jgi:hypothetical protein
MNINWILLSVSLGVTCFGFYLALVALKVCSLARASRSWYKAEGVIIDSCLELAPVSQFGRVRKVFRYWPFIHYRYYVGGMPIIGDRVFPHERVEALLEPEARSIVDQFPIGRRVEVRYNSEDPSNACLLQGNMSVARRYLSLSATLLLLSAILIYLSFSP